MVPRPAGVPRATWDSSGSDGGPATGVVARGPDPPERHWPFTSKLRSGSLSMTLRQPRARELRVLSLIYIGVLI